MKKQTSLINSAKTNIFQLYPKVISIDIEMIKLLNKKYKSTIRLTTKNKSFYADKNAHNYKISLEKSCDAIKKQLEKEKINRLHSKKITQFELDEIDQMYYSDRGGEG